MGTKIKLEYYQEICTSRALIDNLQNHYMITSGFIEIEHIKKEYDSGDFGWVLIKFNTYSALLNFYKSVILEEKRLQII